MKAVAIVAPTKERALAWIADRQGDPDEAEIITYLDDVSWLRQWDGPLVVTEPWSDLPEKVAREVGAWDFKHPGKALTPRRS